jgi:hypothetical protein
MSVQITIGLSPKPLERVESDVAVAGFFADDRPLRGGAARADWRLCGGLSQRIENGDLSGEAGEALLIGCGPALRTPRLLLLGLGERKGFDLARASEGMQRAMERCLLLGCPRLAVSPLGIAPDDVPRHVEALVDGMRVACEQAQGPSSVAVALCVPRPQLEAVWRAFDDVRGARGALAFELAPLDRNPR